MPDKFWMNAAGKMLMTAEGKIAMCANNPCCDIEQDFLLVLDLALSESNHGGTWVVCTEGRAELLRMVRDCQVSVLIGEDTFEQRPMPRIPALWSAPASGWPNRSWDKSDFTLTGTPNPSLVTWGTPTLIGGGVDAAAMAGSDVLWANQGAGTADALGYLLSAEIEDIAGETLDRAPVVLDGPGSFTAHTICNLTSAWNGSMTVNSECLKRLAAGLLDNQGSYSLGIRLFKNDYTPTAGSTWANFTEANYTGYNAASPPALIGGHGDPTAADNYGQCNRNSDTVWTITANPPTTTNRIYGDVLTVNGKACFARRFANYVDMDSHGDSITCRYGIKVLNLVT